MKIQPLFIAIGLSSLLYLSLAVVTLWFNGEPWHWVASQSSTSLRAITTLPHMSMSNPLSETTDLLITKSSSPTIVTAGEPLTYTILVSNTGPATAYNLTIADRLPAGVHFQGESTLRLVKGADPQLHLSLRMLTGTVGSLLPTGHVEIMGRTLVETTSSGASIRNRAYVTATNMTNSGNQYASSETILLTATPTPIPPQTALATASPIATVSTATPTPTPTPTATPTLIATIAPNQADLEIKKSVAYKAVIAGAILTYTMQINNFGPGPAHTIVIQDQLPEGLVFEGLARLSILHGEDPKLLVTQEQLTATISMLDVTGIITITAPVRTKATASTVILVNQAIVTSTTPDQQPGNNHATASLTVIAAPPDTERSFLPLIRR